MKEDDADEEQGSRGETEATSVGSTRGEQETPVGSQAAPNNLTAERRHSHSDGPAATPSGGGRHCTGSRAFARRRRDGGREGEAYIV